ncbi:MAG: LamG-like jellyroll fold domain-containing protein [Chloroflexota bacterium]
MTPRPERSRRVPVDRTSGYVERIGVGPGGMARFHVSAPAAYQLDVVRLGRKALIDPAADVAADRAEVELLASFRHVSAAPQSIEPGSYIHVGGEPLTAGPLSVGLWLRPWRLPVLDDMQWAWAGLITDLDYPTASRFALLIDHLGRVGVYLGDGATFDHAGLHLSEPLLGHRLGTWLHIVATVGPDGLVLYLDGERIMERDMAQGGLLPPTPASRLRLGASAERRRADDFLDADIAAPFVSAVVLSSAQIDTLTADRGRTSLARLGLGPLHAAWDLDEERGSEVADCSGNGRHGQLVQGGTWQIGGRPSTRRSAMPAISLRPTRSAVTVCASRAMTCSTVNGPFPMSGASPTMPPPVSTRP